MSNDNQPQYIQTNVSLTPKQRDKLKELEKLSSKSMSELIRDAIDTTYPDIEEVVPKSPDPDSPPTSDDFKSIMSGWTPELRAKFKLKY